MSKNIGVLTVIFLCTCGAWFILGSTVGLRTDAQDTILRESVGRLWGSAQAQRAPQVTCKIKREHEYVTEENGKTVTKTRTVTETPPAYLQATDITVDLDLDHRKKGLLWYSTYRVDFDGKYTVANHFDTAGEFSFTYIFPAADGIYDSFQVTIDGEPLKNVQPSSQKVVASFTLEPGQSKQVGIAYASQGMDEWWYLLGTGVSQVRNFNLTMTTDFDAIDFPANGMSPTDKIKTDDGWAVSWKYSNLISGIQIGMALPQRLNPGPFVSRLSFFAPVSLFLFLFLMFMISTIKRINIHPMNYFFLCAAFFSFHLLLAYLVDHINVHLATAISAAVSMGLVMSYMRLVVGPRFAVLETGLSQFVYLVLFSYAFFLPGYTGLSITICCIVTLFVVMQFTGRIDWGKQLASVGTGVDSVDPTAPPPPTKR